MALRQAVDQHGNVLNILVQSQRDAKAARRLLAKLMKKQRPVPRLLATDDLASDGVAHCELMRSVEHRTSKYQSNRAGNSHQPTRQRERAMKGFRNVGGTQRFLPAFSATSPHFRAPPHLMVAARNRAEMIIRFLIWDRITGTVVLPAAAKTGPTTDPTPLHATSQPRPRQPDSAHLGRVGREFRRGLVLRELHRLGGRRRPGARWRGRPRCGPG